MSNRITGVVAVLAALLAIGWCGSTQLSGLFDPDSDTPGVEELLASYQLTQPSNAAPTARSVRVGLTLPDKLGDRPRDNRPIYERAADVAIWDLWRIKFQERVSGIYGSDIKRNKVWVYAATSGELDAPSRDWLGMMGFGSAEVRQVPAEAMQWACRPVRSTVECGWRDGESVGIVTWYDTVDAAACATDFLPLRRQLMSVRR